MDKDLAAAILLERMIRAAYSKRRHDGVQPLQWSILRYLKQANGQPRPLTAIARYIGVTAAPASRAVETLHKRGLIDKRRNPENARAVSITITSRGLEILDSDPLLQVASKLHDLPEDENDAFIRNLRTLVLSFEKG